MFNTVTLFHAMAYSASFALFIASVVYMLVYAVHFEAIKHKQPARKQSLNHIIHIFLLAAISFGLFGVFSVYVLQIYFPVITQILPEFFFTLGKFSAPLSLFCFITMFIKLVPFKSLESFAFWLKQEKLYNLLYVLNAIFVVVLMCVDSVDLVVAMSLLLYVPHCLAGVIFSFKGLSNIALSKLYGLLFLAIATAMFFMAFVTLVIGLDKLPLGVMSVVYFIFGMSVLLLSFVIIQFNRANFSHFKTSSKLKMKDYFSDIYYALQRNEFYMLYQPKISLKNDKPSGVEALIRWEHAKKGNIPPFEFIPAAEESEIIDTICEWTISQVVKDAKTFLMRGLTVPISINFSVKNLHPQMVDYLHDTLVKHNVPASAVVVEITESLFLQHSDAQTKALKMINEYGIKLSLDDYGAGFSSLSHLDKLGIDEIKIDKSFVINKSDKNIIIVNSTIQMGHALGMSVVAEGIEDEHTQKLLKDMNCDYAQGFGIAKPMPIDAVSDWLLTQA